MQASWGYFWFILILAMDFDIFDMEQLISRMFG